MSEQAFLAGMMAYKQDAKNGARQRQADPYEKAGRQVDLDGRDEDSRDWYAGYDAAR